MSIKTIGILLIGLTSVILSMGAITFGFLNLPFKFLIDSFNYGSIAVPKLSVFIRIPYIHFFDYIFSTILIISGIGTILVKSWGKTFAYIYAIIIIMLSGISVLVILPGYIIMYSKMIKQGSLSLLPVYFFGGAYLFTLMGALLYPVILLFFFSRPKIKEQFKLK
ncbi:MAG: hypothetical protein ABIG31_02935 [Candidatus Omnitrophota bacterium]